MKLSEFKNIEGLEKAKSLSDVIELIDKHISFVVAGDLVQNATLPKDKRLKDAALLKSIKAGFPGLGADKRHLRAAKITFKKDIQKAAQQSEVNDSLAKFGKLDSDTVESLTKVRTKRAAKKKPSKGKPAKKKTAKRKR